MKTMSRGLESLEYYDKAMTLASSNDDIAIVLSSKADSHLLLGNNLNHPFQSNCHFI
jgi:hypothetical protein